VDITGYDSLVGGGGGVGVWEIEAKFKMTENNGGSSNTFPLRSHLSSLFQFLPFKSFLSFFLYLPVSFPYSFLAPSSPIFKFSSISLTLSPASYFISLLFLFLFFFLSFLLTPARLLLWRLNLFYFIFLALLW
jgi:hypothetical protein